MDCFINQFYQTLKEEIKQILHKFFQKFEEKVIHPDVFYDNNITLKPKLDKHITEKDNYKQDPCEHRCIIFFNILANQIQLYIYIYITNQLSLY